MNNSPLFGWWALARRAIESLTTPRADTAACDRVVEKLARASWLGTTADHVGAAVCRAWQHSQSNRAVSWLVSQLTILPPAAAFGVAGWTTAVAGVTILVLNAMKPIPVGPLSWAVPAGLVGVGAILMAAAGLFARAHEDRRARHKMS